MDELQDGRDRLQELLLNVAVMQHDIERIKNDTREIKEHQKTEFVTRKEFEPIQKLVYGLVGLVLVAVVGALVGLVVIGGGIP